MMQEKTTSTRLIGNLINIDSYGVQIGQIDAFSIEQVDCSRMMNDQTKAGRAVARHLVVAPL